jgi:hypothetical protein
MFERLSEMTVVNDGWSHQSCWCVTCHAMMSFLTTICMYIYTAAFVVNGHLSHFTTKCCSNFHKFMQPKLGTCYTAQLYGTIALADMCNMLFSFWQQVVGCGLLVQSESF